MEKEKNNYAFIDGNNLYRGVKNSGWKINFFRKERAPIKDEPQQGLFRNDVINITDY